MKKATIISSLVWKLFERVGTQGIAFIVQIVLARILLPEMYGTITLVTVFITLAKVFVESGLGTALVQKKDSDTKDFSSVFYLSLALSVILYALIFLSAPWIASFYKDDQLRPVLRVMGLILFFGAINSIQNAWVARHMMFKELFKRSIGALLVSGTAGIAAAYMGLGVWALVVQQLTNQAAITLIMWFTVKWRPTAEFSFPRVKKLFSFGSKLLLSSLIDMLYKDMRTLVIGRLYNASMLGYYSRGQQFPSFIFQNIDGSIQSVMLPALSSHQDDRKKIKSMTRRAVLTSSFFLFPIMIGLAVIAEPMVRLILTDKWMPSVPFLQVFCFTYVFYPINTANLQAINAIGRSDIFLKLQIIKKVIGVVILIISVPIGIFAIAIGEAIAGFLSTAINAFPNKSLINYSYSEQIGDILPALLLSVFMGACIYFFKFIITNDLTLLIVQVISGMAIYIALAKAFKMNSFDYIVQTAKAFMMQRKKDKKS